MFTEVCAIVTFVPVTDLKMAVPVPCTIGCASDVMSDPLAGTVKEVAVSIGANVAASTDAMTALEFITVLVSSE